MSELNERGELGGAQNGRGSSTEQIAFGTRNVAEIDDMVDSFCRDHLHAGIAEFLFRAASVGAVAGVVLDDGRRVAVKVHQPRETRERLQAINDLQSVLWRRGFPCPEPLIGPEPLAHGHGTVESLLDDGELRNTHYPTCRRLIAEVLAWHLEILSSVETPGALSGGWNMLEPEGLWSATAHSPAFDFEATAAGAEWIDLLAAQAKSEIDPAQDAIAGHADWSGKHFRFNGDAIVAVHDWDSLALKPEAAIVGVAAMTFTTRFDLPGVPRWPTPDEMLAFIDDYDSARRAPLSRDDRTQIASWGLLLAAYTARCEHCEINGYNADADPDSFTAALRQYGGQYLDA